MKSIILKKFLAVNLLALCFSFTGCSNNIDTPNIISEPSPTPTMVSASTIVSTPVPVSEEDISGSLIIHFLDVGQADSIVIQLPNEEVMLIDAGNTGDGKLVSEYLQSLKIEKINYLIGTHPHEDHIGGLDTIINDFDIGNIYMPKATNNTKTFEDVLVAIYNKEKQVTTAKAGINIFDYSNLCADFIAPNADTYNNLNNYSAVIKLTYGEKSFLLTGDAESISESEILSNKNDVTADVLKMGHHGSDSSTSDEFLEAVSPNFAIISCGIDNQYGHPAQTLINKLAERNISVYRTDTQGTIIFTSDGKKIEVEMIKTPSTNTTKNKSDTKEPTPEPTFEPTPELTSEPTPKPTLEPVPETKEVTVYITKTGEKYHSSGCSYLRKSKISISLAKAKSQGYTACSRCNPPK